MHDLRLVVPALGVWATAGILIACTDAARSVAVAGWIIAVAGAVIAAIVAGGSGPSRRARVCATVALIAAGCALAASSVAVRAPIRSPAQLVQQASGRTVTVTARVDTQIRPSSGGRFDDAPGLTVRVTITRATWNRVTIDASAPALVLVTDTPETRRALSVGGEVRVRGRLVARSSEQAAAFWLYGRGQVERLRAPEWWLSWADGWRDGFSRATGTLPGDGGALLPGLAIGDTSRVPAELDQAMKLSSLSHLTAVSGSNCAVVIGLIMALGGLLRWRRPLRVGASLVALGGFVILVTPDPSVLRAAIMAVILVTSMGAGRPGRGLPALALAVIVLVTADPWMARNFGFILSVLATGGLLLLTRPLAERFARVMPRALAVALAVPLAAQIACQPVLILLSPTLPVYAVPANLLAEPAAVAATVVGLLSCVCLPFLPPLGFALARVAWVPSAWIAAVANTVARMPGNSLPWLGGTAGMLLLACTVLVVILIVREKSNRFRLPARLARSGAVLGILVLCGGYLGAVIGAPLAAPLSMPRDWQVGACDVGQGDALVVRDVDAYAMIDVGPDPGPTKRCLKRLGIMRVHLLVLTHYDLDHVGGVKAVVGKVDRVLVGPPKKARDRHVLEELTAGGAKVSIARRGDHGLLGSTAWQVLWPVGPQAEGATSNESSVVVEFAGRGLHSLFLGDLDERAQDRLLAAGAPGSVDLVKVAHHGSADQSARLYQHLHAGIGLISVGADNDYGHPTATLLGILRHNGTVPYRTDLQGTLLVAARSDGSLRVWTARRAEPQTVWQPHTDAASGTESR